MSQKVIDTLRAAGVECYTRTQWGSPQEKAGAYALRRRTHPMPAGPADFHFLHITVTRDTDTVQEGAAGARQIEGYGYSTPPMVSYQDLVTNEGKYFQGQDYGVKGTHTVNDLGVEGFPHDLNRRGYACALMQNVGDAVTGEQVQLVAMVFAARELAGLVKRGAPVYPHRKFAAKSCPGDLAMKQLDEIVRLKDQYVRAGALPRLGEPVLPPQVVKTREQLAGDIASLTRAIKKARAARLVALRKREPLAAYNATITALKVSRAEARKARRALARVPKR